MVKSVHFTVSGRVQGVFFRMATKAQADQKNIKGWVCNLADGRVEGVATADQDSLNSFTEWLNRGPELASVSKVDLNEIEIENFDKFEIR